MKERRNKRGFKARILSVITAAAMIMSAVPVLADEADEPAANIVTLAAAGDLIDSGTCGTSATYTLTMNDDESTYTLTISGTGDMTDYSDNNRAPWFSYREYITAVVIESGVTNIGNYAFDRCESMTSITISNTVTTIKIHAFKGCTSLASITLPSSITTIEAYAFNGCTALESITIPNSVTSIGVQLFASCTGLTTVVVGNGITKISNYMFSGCTALTSVTIPNSVTEIGQYAFYNCTSLETVTLPSTVTTINSHAFENYSGAIYVCQSASTSVLKSQVNMPTSNVYYLAENVMLSLEQDYTDDTVPVAIPGQYTLKLSGVDSTGADGVIYRFSSAQMKFEFADGDDISKIGALEITAADNISMLYQGNGEYVFYADPASNNEDCITAATVELGTAVISGAGEFSLGLADSGDYDTQVHGAYISNSIVNDFKYEDKTEFGTGDTGQLYFSAVNGEIELDTTTLTIQIMFPNTVDNTSAAYQDMQVYIDNMVTDDETITLGTPTDSTVAGSSTNTDTTITYTDDINSTGYCGYIITTTVAQGYTANIKFSGAGYRTCNTSIVPSDDTATLKVWNNVMEEATTVVSGGTGTGSLQTTFLAGDIGDDGIINIYDLSAALSYFGTETSTTAASKYSAYDLNRDGKIDSKDVAMVLVSYGK